MKTSFTLHNNFEHCKLHYKGETYSYKSLVESLKTRGREYIKKNKTKKKSIDLNIKKIYKKFEKSNLTDEQLEQYFLDKKIASFKSWKTKLRNLRKKGKLEQSKIDKLNKLGMLWDPAKDHWERMYQKYNEKFLSEMIKIVIKYGTNSKKLNDLENLEFWEIKQRKLFQNKKLNDENLSRLKFIKFSFEPNENKHKISLYKLVRFVGIIQNLKMEAGSRKEFIKHYKLHNEKNYVGATIKINESTINSKRNELAKKELEESEESEESAQFDLKWKASEERAQKDAQRILKTKSSDYFKKKIDYISRGYNPSKEYGDSYWRGRDGLIFDRYYEKYQKLAGFLNNNFDFPRTTIKNVVYKATWLKYDFDSEIKIYAAEKMLMILDEKLIKTGWLNDKKRFKPISFFLAHYKKEKNITGLLWLSEFIGNHQLLTLIYGERIEKICKNLKSTRNFERPDRHI